MMKLKYLISGILIIAFSGCGDELIKSNWLNSEIIIDGNQLDWQGKLHYLEKKHTAVGFTNNSDYLYICIVTSDTGMIMQALTAGLTTWFDPQTDNGKEFGVQYPLPNEDHYSFMSVVKPGNNNKREIFSSRITQLLKKQTEFRIVKKDLFPITQNYLEDNTEVKIKTGFQMDQFVLEMRIPLSINIVWDYNLSLKPGNNVIVKFESGEIKREQFAGNKQGSGMTGGIGGSQRGSGMGKKGQSQNNGNNTGKRSFEKIDFAVDVILAEDN